MRTYDVAIIGAGPAGLAAAVSAKRNGAEKVVIVERDFRMGGILEQCIHMGFGLKYFSEELSGPEYADRFIQMVEDEGIEVMLNTMVLSIDGEDHIIHAANTKGVVKIYAKAIILSMGCRERTRAQVMTPGTRPAGIFTAGTAQRFINVQNNLVGKKAVIIGSGDIGMIMARRLTLEGVKVEGVVEIMPYLAGLTRNKVQCLDDYNIPLYLGHTVTSIQGNLRVEKVLVSKVDEKKEIIPGTEFEIECDTVLFSVGLIPENEISKTAGVQLDPITGGPVVDNDMETNVPGIFACGNVLHVNDLVDNVSVESEKAGKAAAKYAAGDVVDCEQALTVVPGNLVRYVTPQVVKVKKDEMNRLYFRVTNPKKSVRIVASAGNNVIAERKRPFVNPGEIEHIEINGSLLRNVDDDNLVVTVIEE